MAKAIKTVSDLIPDHANANKGTERGRYAVEASLRETGAGRSIVVDKNGKIIAGNKTLESWADISGEIEIVRTDGKKLVVVQREDLDLDDVEGLARKLAYYDNRAGQLGLEWDAEQLFSDLNAGVDLSAMFFDHELNDILGHIDTVDDPLAEWKGMPEFEQEDAFAEHTIKVHFANQNDMRAFAELVQQTVTDSTRFIWFPKQEKEDLKKYRAMQDES
jgi:hypothetical protein